MAGLDKMRKEREQEEMNKQQMLEDQVIHDLNIANSSPKFYLYPYTFSTVTLTLIC